MRFENDRDTFRGCCYCLFCDGARGQVYEEGEVLLRYGDIRCCVSGDHDFGFYWRESLIKATRNRRTSNVSRCL